MRNWHSLCDVISGTQQLACAAMMMTTTTATRSVLLLALVTAIGCGPGQRNGRGDDDTTGDAPPPVCPRCSDDNTAVIDCQGNSSTCGDGQLCSNGACSNACDAAVANHSSVGCDYYAIDMDAAQGPPQDACFAVFVANTSK